MKKFFFFCIGVMTSFSVLAQKPNLNSSIISLKKSTDQKIAVEPVQNNSSAPSVINRSNTNSTNIITPIEIGTSANAYSYGSAGGQRTIVWADDTLKTVMNIHRMGPGDNPPALSGYLAADWATNMGQNASDWHINYQIYAAVLNTGGINYADEVRYPQGVIYNPPGNTNPDSGYMIYFAPNLSNSGSAWGGYSYGRSSFLNQDDTTKHMYWYNAPPYTNVPEDFTITQKGIVLAVDIDQNYENGSPVYSGNLLVHRGTWNPATNDFDYSFNIIIPFQTEDNIPPSCVRIAASPNGDVVWIAAIGNNHGTVPVGPNDYDYPILFKSFDGGYTWSDPNAIQLEGPNGIPAIVNGLYSDSWIAQNFGFPIPFREEIQYTSGFDCDIVVDKWSDPHIGVIIGLGGSEPYSIATGIDSIMAVYDIYSIDGGQTWCGIKMGSPKTFRGSFGTSLTEDNRVNMSITETGDKLVVSWIDTDISGIMVNQNPDLFARGWDLEMATLTSNADFLAVPDNVTFLSDLMQKAYFATTSHFIFKEGDNIRIPVCTQLLSNPADPGAPVNYYYIPDFIYTPYNFNVEIQFDWGCELPPVWGIKEKTQISEFVIKPNPVIDIAKVSVNVSKSGNAEITVGNSMGQRIMTMSKRFSLGFNKFEIDASGLKSGIYFVTIKLDNQLTTGKMIVQ